MTSHTANVRMVSFSPDGKRFASSSEDGSVIVWDAATRKQLFKIELGVRAYSVTYSPNGRWLATGTGGGGKKGDVRIWDATDGSLVRKIFESKYAVMGLAFSPNSKRIVARNSESRTTIWDVETEMEHLKLSRLGGPRPFAFSPDGKLLAVGSGAHSGFLWIVNPANGHRIAEIAGHNKLLFSITFSPDSKTIASASEDGTVRLWTLEPVAKQVARTGVK